MEAKQPGDEQIRQRLDSSVTGLDEHRSESLQRTVLLQTGKDRALKREQMRLEKKYGADHPRVAKINTRLEYNKEAIPEVKTELKRSEITIPELDKNTWMVHGRVVNKKGEGLKGFTVSLYDAAGKIEKRLGYSCTDEHGYYALRYQVKEGGESPFDENADFFLAVSDDSGKICHREKEPVHVVIGRVDYRLIVLDGTQCTPPPDAWHEEEGEEPVNETGRWGVIGAVTYEDTKPATGLSVIIFSKQDKRDYATVTTGNDGEFSMHIDTKTFPDLFKGKAELYLRVIDRSGKTLFMTRKPFYVEVNRMEKLHIRLSSPQPPSRLRTNFPGK